MELSLHQKEKKAEILSALSSGEKRIIVAGSAGVGKTYLISNIIDDLVKDYTMMKHYNNGSIFVTAPTHKALSILQTKIKRTVEFKTIHSALNLRRDVNSKTGVVSFIPTKVGGNDFKNCKICIIDECSMLESKIVDMLGKYKFPIIFTGDKKQLNPVGENETPIFERNYKTIELTEIVRQGADNPIIDLSRDIDRIYFKMPEIINGKGYTYNNNAGNIIDLLAEVNGTDEMKYLSWTNADVDRVNTDVRRRLYGNPMKIEKGETVVFNAPYAGFYTNQEVKVDDVSIVTDYVRVPRHSTRFDSMNMPTNDTDNIKLKYYFINNSFKIVHEHSEQMYNIICNTLNSNCRKFNWNYKGFYFFKESFADFKYNHALSIHKS